MTGKEFLAMTKREAPSMTKSYNIFKIFKGKNSPLKRGVPKGRGVPLEIP